MKKLLLAFGLIGLLALPAQAETRFHMTISVRTPAPQTVRVVWHARCVDDGIVSNSWGHYRVQTPSLREVRPPDLSADSCSIRAHVWNVTGTGLPVVKIRVWP